MLCPSKVVLLRGSLQVENERLKQEVKRRFPDASLAEEVMSLLNSIIHLLPLAAVLDNDILITGRPPVSAQSMAEIAGINRPVTGITNRILSEVFAAVVPNEADVTSMLTRLELTHVIISAPGNGGFSYSSEHDMIGIPSNAASSVLLESGKIRPAKFEKN